MPIRPAHLSDGDRRRLGAWYTPPALVDHLVGLALDPVLAGRSSVEGLRILDPACGDGRFLVAAAERLRDTIGVGFDAAAATCHGVDVDPSAVTAARVALGPSARLEVADATSLSLDGFDVVVGNPPFLSPLVAASGRRGDGGSPYADAATAFLVLALRAARPDGGRVALVLPQSLLAARDAGPAREQLVAMARLEHLWWSPRPVFDASVRTVALVAERGAVAGEVARTVGLPPRPAPASGSPAQGASWSPLLLELAGIPRLPALTSAGALGDVAEVLAGGFRDQYYAVAPLVGDGADGPPLVTAGLVDPGSCAWGRRSTTVAGRAFDAPRVAMAGLAEHPRVLAWARRRLVPKVLVATQTRVLEAAVDEAGAWLPGVPVLSVVPAPGGPEVWHLGAVLSSPVASAWAAAEVLGSGLSASALRVTAPLLRRVPLPAGPLDEAARELRAGQVEAAGRTASRAYGVDDAEVVAWWVDGVRRATTR